MLNTIITRVKANTEGESYAVSASFMNLPIEFVVYAIISVAISDFQASPVAVITDGIKYFRRAGKIRYLSF